MDVLFRQPANTLAAATILRFGLLLYGYYQDAFSALKYTDIDYYVFTDAARNIVWGQSPYLRDTYRYTPLLAFVLQPTAWPGFWFDFGKILFAVGDLLAGYLISLILQTHYDMSSQRALRYSSLWLLNPMVATISTRGSSEGLLAAIVTALLWAASQRQDILAGCLLGFAVHFKIYPFMYGASIIWWLDGRSVVRHGRSNGHRGPTIVERAQQFTSAARLKVASACALTFLGLNLAMYYA